MQGDGAALICGNKFRTACWMIWHYLMVGGVAKHIRAYFVAYSAFPLGKHIMKIYSDLRGAQERAEFEATGKTRFNCCMINAGRLVEQVFGGLKGRWLMCARNMFFQDPDFVKLCICVCCAQCSALTWPNPPMSVVQGAVSCQQHCLKFPAIRGVAGVHTT
jgi:hypothetical protein